MTSFFKTALMSSSLAFFYYPELFSVDLSIIYDKFIPLMIILYIIFVIRVPPSLSSSVCSSASVAWRSLAHSLKVVPVGGVASSCLGG